MIAYHLRVIETRNGKRKDHVSHVTGAYARDEASELARRIIASPRVDWVGVSECKCPEIRSTCDMVGEETA